MTAWSRDLHAETRLNTSDLVWPLILREGTNVEEPVNSLPGVNRLSIDRAIIAAKKAHNIGIPALALFPFTKKSDRSEDASLAFDPDNLMCRAAMAIKDAVPDIGLMGDVALDPYTNHGHDGFLIDNEIDNDRTIDALVKQAVVQAKSGFDIIAPSDMMDGRVKAIRLALEGNGFENTQIMAYAAKYASAFYGPYRDAIGSSGVLHGDKRTYQMAPANTEEALQEVALDIAEGADSIMIKPAGAYLDIIQLVKNTFAMPTFAFQVSGEYAMIAAAEQNGWIDGDRAIYESLTSIKRAGANGIITYFAPRVAELLE